MRHSTASGPLPSKPAGTAKMSLDTAEGSCGQPCLLSRATATRGFRMNGGNRGRPREFPQEERVVSGRHVGFAGSRGSSRWKDDVGQRDRSHGLGAEQRCCANVWLGRGAEKGQGCVGRSENRRTLHFLGPQHKLNSSTQLPKMGRVGPSFSPLSGFHPSVSLFPLPSSLPQPSWGLSPPCLALDLVHSSRKAS